MAICYSSKREANRSAEKTGLRGQISVNSFPCGTRRPYLPSYCQVSCCPAWNVPNLFELGIFFKRHGCSEAVLPKVWSKDHFHQMLTPFQIYRIRISMEWGPRIYSFNKHKRLFWSTVNSEMHCFNCFDPTKGESDSATLFFPCHLAEGTAEMGIWGLGGTRSSSDHSARGIQHVLVEGHCLDAAGQWEYHIPGV